MALHQRCSARPRDCVKPRAEWAGPLGAEEKLSDLGIGCQRTGLTGSTILTVHEDGGAVGDGEGLAGVLLDHGDGDPIAVDLSNGIKQLLGGQGRKAR